MSLSDGEGEGKVEWEWCWLACSGDAFVGRVLDIFGRASGGHRGRGRGRDGGRVHRAREMTKRCLISCA